MRYIIWQRDDYFGDGKLERIYMEPGVVTFPTEPIPGHVQFDFEELPVATMSDFSLDENGNITGEVTWAPDRGWDDSILEENTDLVFGGFYTNVEREDEGGAVTHAVLAGAGIVQHNEIPSRG